MLGCMLENFTVIDESFQNCRDCVEKFQDWLMTEGFFPVTALYNEPQQA